jgi:hypothetical protein
MYVIFVQSRLLRYTSVATLDVMFPAVISSSNPIITVGPPFLILGLDHLTLYRSRIFHKEYVQQSSIMCVKESPFLMREIF